MLFVPPERAVFGSKNDLIDYVSRGLPPTKKNYEKFMNAVICPMTDEQIANNQPEDVVISEKLFLHVDEEEFAEILSRVYHNNVRNRNTAIASFITGLAAGVAVTAKICGACCCKETSPTV